MAPSSVKKSKSPPPPGQKNLFSFFSKKKTVSPCESAGKVKDVGGSPNSTASSGGSNNASSPGSTKMISPNINKSDSVSKSKPRAKSIISPSQLRLLRRITVGTRLAVYWPDDKEYYPCVTTHHRPTPESEYVYTLQYDDSEIETIDLATERFRIIGGVKRSCDRKSEDCANGDGAELKKRRRILEDTDSEEDADMDDSNSADESGSEYKGGNDDSEDESLGDAFDDSYEEEIGVNCKKNRKSSPPLKKGAKITVTRVGSSNANANIPKGEKPTRVISPTPHKDHCKTSTLSSESTSNKIDFANFESSKTTPGSSAASSPQSNRSGNRSINSSPSMSPVAVTQSQKDDGRFAPPKPVAGAVNPAGSHFHNHLKFFTTERRDIHRNPPGHPNYSPLTLHVDYNELERQSENGKLSPAQRQWWELKAQYADTVLLFKTGKFYEMFHDDADVGVSVLGFVYMKGTSAHAGFPESAYGVMVSRLVDAGYKVARVEQTETPDALKERKKRTVGKKPQVVCREVCGIVTKGTRTYCYLDDDSCFRTNDDRSGGGRGASTGPLVVIKEILLNSGKSTVEMDVNDEATEDDDDGAKAICEYGITVVDAITGTVTLGQFADDVLRSRICTLIASYGPSEVLIEGGENGASKTLVSLLQSACSPTTVISRVNPIERFPRSTAVSLEVRKMLDRTSADVHPWDATEAVKELHRRSYYPRSSRKKNPVNGNVGDCIGRWPEVLQACIQGGAELALSSFGAALFYLQRSLVDTEILSMGNVKAYIPPNNTLTSAEADKTDELSSTPEQLQNLFDKESRRDEGVDLVRGDEPHVECRSHESGAYASEAMIDHMALDGTTIANLELLHQITTGSFQGSLLSKIDFTQSPHGSRLLRAWLLRPLFRRADIDRRADVVEELTGGSAAMAMSEARTLLKKTGDIERLLSRVHSMGGGGAGAKQSEDEGNLPGGYHPNERAVLYELDKHTRRQVGDFGKLLRGLRAAAEIPDLFENVDIQSPMLAKIVRSTDVGGCFPSCMKEELDWFFDNFDLNKAARGEFEPTRGMDEEFDAACDAIENIKNELNEYKDEMCSRLRARSAWKYINLKEDSKDKYLIELPASIPVPDDFYVKGKRGKGSNLVHKYRTPEVEEMVQNLERAIDVKNQGKAAGMRLVFAKFASMKNIWLAATHATAMLDALGSLAEIAVQPGFCRPKILDCPPSSKPGIKILQGRHPCVDVTHSGGDFIPNDLILGGGIGDTFGQEGFAGEASVLLLSGPNMGGKSTLLRQTCLISILAQMGSYVPAEQCALTPVDRIFTRLGASDRILLGQSTFFVELAETAAAVRGATRRSLVIMDELGRGTSTFDGTAIASATVKHLVERNKCLALFATHYHSLLEDWKNEPSIRLGHMECIVENDSDKDNEVTGNITFLYTLGDGPCPKSFGVNVARLAGLPDDVLQKAKAVSTAFEAEMNGENMHKILPSSAEDTARGVLELITKSGIDAVGLDRVWESLQ